MGEGDSISIVLGISGAKPRHRKALQRIKIRAASEAPFPCYYAFLEREVPSTTKGAKVGKKKKSFRFQSSQLFWCVALKLDSVVIVQGDPSGR